jgi:hypothetical protein
MKIFWITLEETIRNVAEVEVMAEDEPSARKIALESADADFEEADRTTIVYKVITTTRHDHSQKYRPRYV